MARENTDQSKKKYVYHSITVYLDEKEKKDVEKAIEVTRAANKSHFVKTILLNEVEKILKRGKK